MLLSNLQLPLVILRLEDDKLERTSCCARACAPNRCFRLIVSAAITLIVVSRFDIRMMGYAPLEEEAVAMLHAMALESIVGFFMGAVKRIRRGSNILHAYYRTDSYSR